MTYQEALKNIFSRSDSDMFFNAPFLVYSFLSDMASSYQDQKLAKAYFLLNQLISVPALIQRMGVDFALSELVYFYQKLKNQVSENEFRLCVRGIVECFDPCYFQNKEVKNTDKKIAVVQHKKEETTSICTPLNRVKKPIPTQAKQSVTAKAMKQKAKLILNDTPTDCTIPFVTKNIKHILVSAKNVDIYLVRTREKSGMMLATRNGTQGITFQSLEKNDNVFISATDLHNQPNNRAFLYLFIHDSPKLMMDIKGKANCNIEGNITVGKLQIKENDGYIHLGGNYDSIRVNSARGHIHLKSLVAKDILCVSKNKDVILDIPRNDYLKNDYQHFDSYCYHRIAK